MSYDLLIKTKIQNNTPQEILESLRGIARQIHSDNRCSSFIPINRANVGRIDCYIFGSSVSKDHILSYLPKPLQSLSVVELSQPSSELELVRAASTVVEILLTKFSAHNIHEKLFDEHIHYILNSLGNDKLMEATQFLANYNKITQGLIYNILKIISTNNG